MKRLAVSILCSLFASFAYADCDLELKGVITKADGKKYGWMTHGWGQLDPAGLQAVRAEGEKVFRVAQKQENKGGPFTLTLTEDVVNCTGQEVVLPKGAELRGLNQHGLNAIGRAGHKADDALLKLGEDAAGKGKKHAWGKD